LSLQVTLFSKYEDLSFILTNASHFGERAGQQPADFTDIINQNLFLSMLNQNFPLYSPSLIFKSSVLGKISKLNEAFLTCCDVDFIYRLAYYTKGAFINERLIRIRKHLNNMSALHDKTAVQENETILSDFSNAGLIDNTTFRRLTARLYYNNGIKGFKNGQRLAAVWSFARAIKVNPIYYRAWMRFIHALLLPISGKAPTKSEHIK